MTKVCSTCGEEKPLSAFGKRKGSKDGHTGQCRECLRTRYRKYREVNKERIAAAKKAYQKANADQVAATEKAYREAHKEHKAAMDKARYDANPEPSKARARAWKAANPERAAAAKGAWYDANPERDAATKKAWRETHPGRVRDNDLRRKYGITLADYDDMLEEQLNGCAICGMTPEENGQRLAVDHDHDTGKVRSLLCSDCNIGIGCLQDSSEICRRAMLYLQTYKK